MKLLAVASYLGYYGEIDGVVTIYKNLINQYKKENIDVDVLAYGPENKIIKDGKVRIIQHKPIIPISIDLDRKIDAALLFTNLKNKLKGPYDIVESSTPGPMGYMAARIAKRDKAPFITFYHTELSEYARIRALDAFPFSKKLSKLWSNILYTFMEKWLGNYYKKGDAAFAISKYVGNKMKKYSNNIRILGGGFDANLFNPDKKTAQNKIPRAIYVGRIAPEKNLEWLADIFSKHNLPITFVGDGCYKKQLEKRLPNAYFIGKLSLEECAQEYGKNDYFVFPSKVDTYGLAVLEAMATGIPGIVTNEKGPKELIENGKNGFVVSSKKEFEEKVLFMVNNNQERKKMGKNAREYVKTKNWNAFFNNMLKAYRNLIKNNPKK